MHIDSDALIDAGLDTKQARKWSSIIQDILTNTHSREQTWFQVADALLKENEPFATHLAVYQCIYPQSSTSPHTAPAWQPSLAIKESSNLSKVMSALKLNTVTDLHQYSRDHMPAFWEMMLNELKIQFTHNPEQILSVVEEESQPNWFVGGKLNIVDSCFKADPKQTAIISQHQDGSLTKLSYAELKLLTDKLANSLIHDGLKVGDPVAIIMPMTAYAVASYLAVIKAGAVVVSIADSFSSREIETRNSIAKTKYVITQDIIPWNNKNIPLYEKVCRANPPRCIVVKHAKDTELRKQDAFLDDVLLNDPLTESIACNPMDTCNILFSSGTTGTPKAIPWNHSTAIKAASDAYFHQNIQAGDVLAWPTNLGWMMGPWLIFASLINNATIALAYGAPKDRFFGEFIQHAGVTMLGVVPTLVASWRQTKCMENLDWSKIKSYSSTGECSNPEDMFYLMWLSGYKPVIEYCGGTEIGGAYISSTLIQNNCPSVFTTPTMGSDFIILNDEDKPADQGQVCLVAPALGLSTRLLNADHHETYFAGMPILNNIALRRHGDQLVRLDKDAYQILGRVDDTMNIGGIKISSAEIERVLGHVDNIDETAAISVKHDNKGPDQLIVYAAVTNPSDYDKADTILHMQKLINQQLNPLFKIHDLVFVKHLPKTASNKIMRRVLRDEYLDQLSSVR